MTRNVETLFPLHTETGPTAVISEEKVVDCNELFLKLINRPWADAVGYKLTSFLAIFIDDNGERTASPLALGDAASTRQLVLLKPRQHDPITVEVQISNEMHKGKSFQLARFMPVSREILQQQRREIDAFHIAASLWHMAMWDHDHLQNEINLSPVMREIYGVDTEDAFSFEEAGRFIHPDDMNMEAVLNAHDPAGTGLFDLGFRIIRPSGEIRWVHSRSQTFFGEIDGKQQPVRTSGAIVDFTDEYMLKKALQEQKQRLSDILDSLPSMLMVVNKQGQITQWNGITEMMTAILETDTQQPKLEVACPPKLEVACPPKLEVACPMVISEIDRIYASIEKQTPLMLTRVAHVHHGDSFFYNISVTPLLNSMQSEVVVRIDEVTEQVRIEQMLVQSEKLLSVGGLAAGMAHEINNPLAAIMQNVQVITSRLTSEQKTNRDAAQKNNIKMEDLQGYLNERKIFNMLESIGKASTRAATIVNNMLGFVRVSNNKKVDCNLPALIDTTLDLARNDYDLKKKYDFKKIAIQRLYQTRDIYVFCDAGKIQQVLLNLIRNSGQALFSAGIADPQIVVRVEKGTTFTRIEFEDNGPGIPPDIVRRVFEPFFTTKPPGEGTGLGLSISYSIITKEHLGKMHAEQGAHGGARFVIELPNEMPPKRGHTPTEPVNG